MSKKLRLLLNIGSADQQRLQLKENQEGKTVTVSEPVAKELLTRGWATSTDSDAPAPEARPSRKQATEAPAGVPKIDIAGGQVDMDDDDDDDDSADTSPVSASNADEAIDQIGRMRSKERLQSIVASDPRTTVKEAARKRLGAL
jgi:hypothetical protein